MGRVSKLTEADRSVTHLEYILLRGTDAALVDTVFVHSSPEDMLTSERWATGERE